jgi:hypothetical protein
MNPRHPNVGTIGHIDHGPARMQASPADHRMYALMEASLLPPPTHWPPRLTRMALAVRMGTTRMLLERRP